MREALLLTFVHFDYNCTQSEKFVKSVRKLFEIPRGGVKVEYRGSDGIRAEGICPVQEGPDARAFCTPYPAPHKQGRPLRNEEPLLSPSGSFSRCTAFPCANWNHWPHPFLKSEAAQKVDRAPSLRIISLMGPRYGAIPPLMAGISCWSGRDPSHYRIQE